MESIMNNIAWDATCRSITYIIHYCPGLVLASVGYSGTIHWSDQGSQVRSGLWTIPGPWLLCSLIFVCFVREWSRKSCVWSSEIKLFDKSMMTKSGWAKSVSCRRYRCLSYQFERDAPNSRWQEWQCNWSCPHQEPGCSPQLTPVTGH